MNSSMYKFLYDCTSPNNLEQLIWICDNMREISVHTFLKYIPIKQINNVLLYDFGYTRKILINDYSVNFYKFKNKTHTYLIFENSCIEYVFKKEII